MRNWILGLLAFVVLCFGVAVASAQWAPLTGSSISQQIESAQRKVIELKISQAKALQSSGTATAAQKAAANCEVQKAVKSMISGIFTCSGGCGC